MAINIFHPIEVDREYFSLHIDEYDLLQKKLASLPDSINFLLYANATPEKIRSISEKHGFQQTQSEILSRLIRKIAVAEIYFGDLLTELQSQLDLPEGRAREVAKALMDELFAPALEDIKKLNLQYFKDRIAANAAAKPKTVEPEVVGNVINLKNKK